MAEQTAVLVPRKKGAEIGDLELDVTLNERHSLGAEATGYPLEPPVGDGEEISDNVIQRADEIALDGLWTDSPRGALEAEVGRARDLFAKLVELKEAASLLQIVTGLRVYTSMVITSIETARDKTTGFTVPVSVGLKRINTVKAKREFLPPDAPKEEVKHTAGGAPDKGRQKASAADDQTEKESSVLYDLFYK